MKISTRRLLLNRYYLITFLLLIIVPYLSWYFFSGYFEASFIWDLSDMRGTREEYFQTVFSFQNFAIDSFSLIQMILPVFSGIVMLPFLRDQKLYPICYLRTKSYRRFVLSNIIKHVLAGCIVLYLAYCVLKLIGASILHPVVLYYERDLYMDILGRSFYSDHPILFLLLDGFHKYIIFGSVYALFFAAVSFYTRRWYLCVLIPVVYYFGLDLLCSAIGSMYSVDLFYFSPAYTIVPDGRFYTSTIQVLAPLLPPLLFSIATFIWGLSRKRKHGDVYAAA
ncbi:MAG: hypothetical protein MRZ30_08050 [Oscillospiraceae bacterium]|nr:hypothetical protein [Oscillospiraceae bacterium]